MLLHLVFFSSFFFFPSHRYANIVRKIKELPGAPWGVILKDKCRECNACANWLAKHGAHHDDLTTFWEQAPLDLGLQLLSDASSVEVLRI